MLGVLFDWCVHSTREEVPREEVPPEEGGDTKCDGIVDWHKCMLGVLVSPSVCCFEGVWVEVPIE